MAVTADIEEMLHRIWRIPFCEGIDTTPSLYWQGAGRALNASPSCECGSSRRVEKGAEDQNNKLVVLIKRTQVYTEKAPRPSWLFDDATAEEVIIIIITPFPIPPPEHGIKYSGGWDGFTRQYLEGLGICFSTDLLLHGHRRRAGC